jgi:hypothetical protein
LEEEVDDYLDDESVLAPAAETAAKSATFGSLARWR